MSHDIVVKQHGGTIEAVTEPGTLTGGFCRKEWIENLLLDVGRDARTVVPDADFDPVAEVSCHCFQLRLKAIADRPCTLGCGVKPVRDQVQLPPRFIFAPGPGQGINGSN